MPMAAGPVSLTDRPATIQAPALAAAASLSDSVARDSIIAWFRGEFAAANAIIDALCGHLVQLSESAGVGSEYEAVLVAIHRRRLNWIPVLQMQKYHSIGDVAMELRKVTVKKTEEIMLKTEKKEEVVVVEASLDSDKVLFKDETTENENERINGVVDDLKDDSPESDITDTGSQELHQTIENIEICSNHEDCDARTSLIKLTKGFSAKEHVKGHKVNVVKGLKLYEDIFTEQELSKLSDFVHNLRTAGQNGELSGETFILFNKQVKGNRRELIQLGVPIFGQVKDEPSGNNNAGNIDPIPALLQSVIDHLIQWQMIPQYKRPNGCVINFFEEDEHSQPFLKPPHLEQPISTLVLSESTMAYGRTLVSENDGNFRGPLMLSLKQGSVLVMRGNSADVARHIMCPSPNKRVSITFFRVRPELNQGPSPPTTPQAGAIALWQPNVPMPFSPSNGYVKGYEAMDMMPKWGVLRAPLLMLAPLRPMVLGPKKLNNGGTGVFLPWTVGSRKPARHLPPRAQKGRLLALPSPSEPHTESSSGDKVV